MQQRRTKSQIGFLVVAFLLFCIEYVCAQSGTNPSSTSSATSSSVTMSPTSSSPTMMTTPSMPPTSSSPIIDCNGRGTKSGQTCTCESVTHTGDDCEFTKLVEGRTSSINVASGDSELFILTVSDGGMTVTLVSIDATTSVYASIAPTTASSKIINSMDLTEGTWYILIKTTTVGGSNVQLTATDKATNGAILGNAGTSSFHFIAENSIKYISYSGFSAGQDVRFTITELGGSQGTFVFGTTPNPTVPFVPSFKRAIGDAQRFTIMECSGPDFYVGVIGGAGGSSFEITANGVSQPKLPSDTKVTVVGGDSADKLDVSWTPSTGSNVEYSVFWSETNLNTPCDFSTKSGSSPFGTASSTTITVGALKTYRINVLAKDTTTLGTSVYTQATFVPPELIDSSDSDEGLDGGIIALIIILVLLALALLGFAGYKWWDNKQKEDHKGHLGTEMAQVHGSKDIVKPPVAAAAQKSPPAKKKSESSSSRSPSSETSSRSSSKSESTGSESTSSASSAPRAVSPVAVKAQGALATKPKQESESSSGSESSHSTSESTGSSDASSSLADLKKEAKEVSVDLSESSKSSLSSSGSGSSGSETSSRTSESTGSSGASSSSG